MTLSLGTRMLVGRIEDSLMIGLLIGMLEVWVVCKRRQRLVKIAHIRIIHSVIAISIKLPNATMKPDQSKAIRLKLNFAMIEETTIQQFDCFNCLGFGIVMIRQMCSSPLDESALK